MLAALEVNDFNADKAICAVCSDWIISLNHIEILDTQFVLHLSGNVYVCIHNEAGDN